MSNSINLIKIIKEKNLNNFSEKLRAPHTDTGISHRLKRRRRRRYGKPGEVQERWREKHAMCPDLGRWGEGDVGNMLRRDAKLAMALGRAFLRCQCTFVRYSIFVHRNSTCQIECQ